jgi:hypothetical protein
VNLRGGGHVWEAHLVFPAGLLAAGRAAAIAKARASRRTDRQRVEAGRESLAKLPGTVGKLTRAEAAAELGCSIRHVQRLQKGGRLRPCEQHGREVAYWTRDVRSLDLAPGKGR